MQFAVIRSALIVSLVSASFAQNLSIGGAVGTNLTSNFRTFSLAPGVAFSNTSTLSGGGVAQWSFSRSLSLEVDGLYRRMHALVGPISTFSVVTWEFPVLAKYRFALGRVQPVLEAGPSFRATGNLNDIHPSHYGFTAGIGFERKVGRLSIEPVVRYTRWRQDVEVLRSDVRTKPDQLEFLVGFRAPSRSNARPFGTRVSLGLIAGANLTADYASAAGTRIPPALDNISFTSQLANASFISTSGPRSFSAGPLVEVAMPKNLSVEIEGIYRPLRSSVQIFFPGGRRSMTVADHRSSWEFPVLARYRGRIRGARPFVELGPSVRTLQDIHGAMPYGLTAGAGMEQRLGRLKVAPRLRFTHWAQYPHPAATDPRRSEVALFTGFSL